MVSEQALRRLLLHLPPCCRRPVPRGINERGRQTNVETGNVGRFHETRNDWREATLGSHLDWR
jgi:hypothetical protein